MGKIVGVIVKEGAFAVGTDKGVPVLVAPIAVLAYAYVAHCNLAAVVYDGYCKGLCAVFCGYNSAATERLLYERCVAVNDKPRPAV
jgi:hypothetical protein